MVDYRDRASRDRDKKPSWRDMDRKKDRSSHVEGAGPRPNLDERKATTGYHQYKNELDRLFTTGEKSKLVGRVMSGSQAAAPNSAEPQPGAEVPKRQQLLRAIRSNSSQAEIEKRLDEFLSEWELPLDMEILTQALEHSDVEVQARALEMIASWLDGHMLERPSLLRSRVRRLATRSDDARVADLAKAVNRKLPA